MKHLDAIDLVGWFVVTVMIGVICQMLGRDRQWEPGVAFVLSGTLGTVLAFVTAYRIARRRRNAPSSRRGPWSRDAR